MQEIYSPIFVLGTQRCGSTLLTRMLSAHSQLYIQNEMNLHDIFVSPLSHEIVLQRTRKRMKEYGNDIESMEAQGIKWGWKDPLFTPHLKHLKEHCKSSKFILLIRDPRAVVASYIENRWGLGTNEYTGAQRWVDEVSKQLEFAEDTETNCFVVKYEDLLNDPQSNLSAMCEFLDVEFEQSMVEYYKKPLEFRENDSNVNTQKPLDSTKVAKWKNKFSDHQIAIINGICEPLMEKLGYSDDSEMKKEPSRLGKFYYLAHQKIIGEIQLQYQWRKSRFKRKFG